MKLVLLKLVVAILATFGIFFSTSTIHVRFCNPGKTPLSAPSNCEPITLINQW